MGIFTDGEEYHRGPTYVCNSCMVRNDEDKIINIPKTKVYLCIKCLINFLKENEDIAKKIKISVAMKRIQQGK